MNSDSKDDAEWGGNPDANWDNDETIDENAIDGAIDKSAKREFIIEKWICPECGVATNSYMCTTNNVYVDITVCRNCLADRPQYWNCPECDFPNKFSSYIKKLLKTNKKEPEGEHKVSDKLDEIIIPEDIIKTVDFDEQISLAKRLSHQLIDPEKNDIRCIHCEKKIPLSYITQEYILYFALNVAEQNELEKKIKDELEHQRLLKVEQERIEREKKRAEGKRKKNALIALDKVLNKTQENVPEDVKKLIDEINKGNSEVNNKNDWYPKEVYKNIAKDKQVEEEKKEDDAYPLSEWVKGKPLQLDFVKPEAKNIDQAVKKIEITSNRRKKLRRINLELMLLKMDIIKSIKETRANVIVA